MIITKVVRRRMYEETAASITAYTCSPAASILSKHGRWVAGVGSTHLPGSSDPGSRHARFAGATSRSLPRRRGAGYFPKICCVFHRGAQGVSSVVRQRRTTARCTGSACTSDPNGRVAHRRSTTKVLVPNTLPTGASGPRLSGSREGKRN